MDPATNSLITQAINGEIEVDPKFFENLPDDLLVPKEDRITKDIDGTRHTGQNIRAEAIIIQQVQPLNGQYQQQHGPAHFNLHGSIESNGGGNTHFVAQRASRRVTRDYPNDGVVYAVALIPQNQTVATPPPILPSFSPDRATTCSPANIGDEPERKRKKYTLKKDLEREDEKYKEDRERNREAVRRCRAKKGKEEAEEKKRNEEEMEALRGIIKIQMECIGRVESTRLLEVMNEPIRTVYMTIYRELFPQNRY